MGPGGGAAVAFVALEMFTKLCMLFVGHWVLYEFGGSYSLIDHSHVAYGNVSGDGRGSVTVASAQHAPPPNLVQPPSAIPVTDGYSAMNA